jgi:hypothetical protein
VEGQEFEGKKNLCAFFFSFRLIDTVLSKDLGDKRENVGKRSSIERTLFGGKAQAV